MALAIFRNNVCRRGGVACLCLLVGCTQPPNESRAYRMGSALMGRQTVARIDKPRTPIAGMRAPAPASAPGPQTGPAIARYESQSPVMPEWKRVVPALPAVPEQTQTAAVESSVDESMGWDAPDVADATSDSEFFAGEQQQASVASESEPADGAWSEHELSLDNDSSQELAADDWSNVPGDEELVAPTVPAETEIATGPDLSSQPPDVQAYEAATQAVVSNAIQTESSESKQNIAQVAAVAAVAAPQHDSELMAQGGALADDDLGDTDILNAGSDAEYFAGQAPEAAPETQSLASSQADELPAWTANEPPEDVPSAQPAVDPAQRPSSVPDWYAHANLPEPEPEVWQPTNKTLVNEPKADRPEMTKAVEVAHETSFAASLACQPPCGSSGEYCGSCYTGMFPGVACGPCGHCMDLDWDAMRLIPWESLAQGEYIGPARLPHVPEYRLRVDDIVEFVYRLTQKKSLQPYRVNVGDQMRVESLTDENLQRDVIVQPDGTITVRQLGQIPAAGRTLDELRLDLDERYKEFGNVKDPSITVTPLKLNSQLEELRATVDARAGQGGQTRLSKVTPEGTIQLPAIGSVPAQGLTLDELKVEVEQRYNDIVVGLEITPILSQRAPRFIYVTGEVAQPGRYTLEAPTTLIQAIALAGSWNIGADLENIVILRRDENWQLTATKVDLHKALFGKEPCPEGEIWLRDSDIVLLPKSCILWSGDLINLVFTRGIYGVFPLSFNRLTTF